MSVLTADLKQMILADKCFLNLQLKTSGGSKDPMLWFKCVEQIMPFVSILKHNVKTLNYGTCLKFL